MSRPLTVILATAATLVLTLGTAYQGSTVPDRIEEDWQLVLGNPDTAANCPQLSTSMSPSGSDSVPVFLFKLNYRDRPHYAPGGLSAQVWQSKSFLSNSDQGTAQINTPQETITWTQKMTLAGGKLNYKVLSGMSTTWGAFGVNDTDLFVSTPSSLVDLSGYTPDKSVAMSGASFGPNRVTSMTLLQVRYYQGSTLLSTDTTARQVNLTP